MFLNYDFHSQIGISLLDLKSGNGCSKLCSGFDLQGVDVGNPGLEGSSTIDGSGEIEIRGSGSSEFNMCVFSSICPN